MTAVLLDSHALLWALTRPDRLSKAAGSALAEASTVYLSAVTFYELEFKRTRGRLRGFDRDFATLPSSLLSHLSSQGLSLLSITPEQAVAATLIPMTHGDPWDRILIAQARDLKLALISADAILRDQAGDTPVIW